MILIESISMEIEAYRFAEALNGLSVFPEFWKGLVGVNS